MYKQDNNILIRVEALSGEHHVMRVLFALLFVCLAGYVYFVSISIMNVIANREAAAESEKLRSIVGSLEREYFMLSDAISLDHAGSHGLTKTGDTTFIRRSANVASNSSR